MEEEDNQVLLSDVRKDDLLKLIKHVDLEYRLVVQLVQTGDVQVALVLSKLMGTDTKTENLALQRFLVLLKVLGRSWHHFASGRVPSFYWARWPNEQNKAVDIKESLSLTQCKIETCGDSLRSICASRKKHTAYSYQHMLEVYSAVFVKSIV